MFLAAIFVFAAALGLYGMLLFRLARRREAPLFVLCTVLTLPLSWAALHYGQLPLNEWLRSRLGEGTCLHWLQNLYAPLMHEPAKLLPLLIPLARQGITRHNAGRFGLALGLGFALGEIFTVGERMEAQRREVTALPFYQLSGFMVTRFMTCAIQGALSALALFTWRRWNSLVLGLALAISAHFVFNFPLNLIAHGIFGRQAALAQGSMFLWLTGCFVLAGFYLARLQRPGVSMPLAAPGSGLRPV